MKVLVYKQTHLGDPDLGGEWHDCMGEKRLYKYDAVVAIGGHGPEPRGWGIAGKVTWVGVKPHVRRGIVRFEHFRCFGNAGPLTKDCLPTLVKRMKAARLRMIQDEDAVDQFVEEYAGEAPPSFGSGISYPCCRANC